MFNGIVRQRKAPAPVPKGTWKCKQYKEGNFAISSDALGGGVMNFGNELCFFRTEVK